MGVASLNRDGMLEHCRRTPDLWDLIIIGGGSSGLGAAVDAASRGYRTLLLEQSDFAKGTSSRSTKLIHGGLRYLKQGNLSLVVEALQERGRLCRNAPHLVSHLGFLVPHFHWWEKIFYRIGIKFYDVLAGKLGIEKSRSLSRSQVLLRMPTLKASRLRGATLYYDAQFDDARLALNLAQTAADLGGVLVNYMRVDSLIKTEGKIQGVIAIDQETKKQYPFSAKVVINATGVFSDQIRHMDDPNLPHLIAPSQGVHLVLPRKFMPGSLALLVPHTADGRVLFSVPWHQHLLVGTTDTATEHPCLEPRPLDQEIDFILSQIGGYLTKAPSRSDVLSVFAGLRPLIRASGKSTKALSRDHTIEISPSGLLTIAGGKWTTYRKMGEDVIDQACALGHLKFKPCRTKTLRLHAYVEKTHALDPLSMYGSDLSEIQRLIAQHPHYGQILHPDLPYLAVQVVWAVRREMARTLEDVLARRTRALFLNVEAALEIAPRVAALMAQEMGKSQEWEAEQLTHFRNLASIYRVI